jgi:hypothetical protein
MRWLRHTHGVLSAHLQLRPVGNITSTITKGRPIAGRSGGGGQVVKATRTSHGAL